MLYFAADPFLSFPKYTGTFSSLMEISLNYFINDIFVKFSFVLVVLIIQRSNLPGTCFVTFCLLFFSAPLPWRRRGALYGGFYFCFRVLHFQGPFMFSEGSCFCFVAVGSFVLTKTLTTELKSFSLCQKSPDSMFLHLCLSH